MNIEEPAELIAHLRATNRIGAEDNPAVLPLAGGVSNRTVLVRTGSHGWVLKQALPKLRVAEDWFCDPARIQREALGLKWLQTLAPPGAVPRFLFEDPAHHVLAMEAVPSPHSNWKTQLLGGAVNLDLVRQFGTLLGTLHRRSAQHRDPVAELFADRAYFEALRLVPYYQTAAGRNRDTAEFFDTLMAETRATRLCLVHGDFSPKNILVHQERLVLLDHEVIHFGDPAFDVGFSLTHLLSKAQHVPGKRAALLEAARLHWDCYRTALAGPSSSSPSATPFNAATLADLEPRAVRHTLACLLARVDGRSPLEYLRPAERDRQRQFAKRLMREAPITVSAMIEAFAMDTTG